MRRPGYWFSRVLKLQDGASIDTTIFCTKLDLLYFKYRVQSVSQNTPSSSSIYHSLAVRIRTTGQWDYHFMRLHKTENRWSFKNGWGGPVFQLISGLRPNQIEWKGYVFRDNLWREENAKYDGDLYYIVYK